MDFTYKYTEQIKKECLLLSNDQNISLKPRLLVLVCIWQIFYMNFRKNLKIYFFATYLKKTTTKNVELIKEFLDVYLTLKNSYSKYVF